MIKSINKSYVVKSTLITLIGFLAIFTGMYTSVNNHFMTGAILVSTAIVLYFLTVFLIAERNWLDVRAVFTGVWLATIGLAALRLTDYQEQWLNKTWILLAIAYLMFQIGASIGIGQGKNVFMFLKKWLLKLTKDKISFSIHEKRLFPICVVVTLLGIICFAINVMIRGYIPAFSDNIYAYNEFYTKFHLFAVAATAISGLCYYCIKTQEISILKKIILWICIFYLVILFPILVVSRGVFIIAALSLTTTIFYLNKKKLFVFISCLAVMVGVYLITSALRGYTDEQLDALFQPSDIIIENVQPEEDKQDSTDEEMEQDNLDKEDEDLSTDETESFALPPRVAFLYGYLTVSHDNFNEAVENTVGYTWGARQLYPFNVLLRIQGITDTIESGEFYKVRPYLTTVNMMGLFYYDFHEIGVVVCTFLWALLFGVLQGFHEKAKGPFSLFVLGFSMNAVVLSFFSSWVDSFELWMFCGVVFVVAVITCLEFKKQNN